MPGLLLLLLVVPLIAAAVAWRNRRSASIIDAWAGENGYEVVSARRQ